ncbi:MAG TPA: HAD family phosphatase [Pyrinomonadaceae bacterium]|nr:HAD family phosphatase [Pyrinomonadaceae bacterium]
MKVNEADGAARAVLWDVDGTLIDSAEYHWLTWRETLLGEGYALTRAEFNASFGQRNDEILRGYFGVGLEAAEVARIGDAKEERYRELVRARGIEPLPGVRRWLGKLKTEGWRQAIASSAPRLNLDAILKALGLEDFFDAIASAEDVSRGKPDPQIFLSAAAKVSVPPQRCVVVEDAPAGTEAARRAGMRRVGVLSSHGALEADVVVSSLAELPDDTFDQLLLRR